METSKPTTDWRLWVLLGAASVMAAGFAIPASAQANSRVSADHAVAKAAMSLSLGQLGLGSAATSATHGESVATRAKRPRVWNMPVGVAKRATLAVARNLYTTTTPNEFDDSDSIVGESDWDEYGAGDCRRKSRSRVNCLGAIEGYFDIIDGNDQVVGEDTFYCVWEQTNWYPRAKKKRLKADIQDVYCGWESDD